MMIKSKKRIVELEKRIIELEQEIERLKLEKNFPTPNPIPLPMPTYPPQELFPKPFCHVCGLKFDGPMGYSCPRLDCPSGVVYC